MDPGQTATIMIKTNLECISIHTVDILSRQHFKEKKLSRLRVNLNTNGEEGLYITDNYDMLNICAECCGSVGRVVDLAVEGSLVQDLPDPLCCALNKTLFPLVSTGSE